MGLQHEVLTLGEQDKGRMMTKEKEIKNGEK